MDLRGVRNDWKTDNWTFQPVLLALGDQIATKVLVLTKHSSTTGKGVSMCCKAEYSIKSKH